MPVLKNPRHERFSQELAKGKTAGEAYVLAGYKENRHNAAALARKQHILTRVAEILEAAGTRVEISIARVLKELGKIGFADIRNAVRWRSNTTVVGTDPDTDEPQFRSFNEVQIIGSHEIDDDTAAAIVEVSQSKEGTLRIKLADKRAALVDIGRHLGMFVEKHEHTGADGGPIQTEDVSARNLVAERIAGIASRSPANGSTGKPH